MEYLEKNYVTFDNNSKKKDTYFLGEIKNSTGDLVKVFGNPIKMADINKWIFRMNESQFTVYQKKGKKDWHLSSNSNDEFKIKQFLMFLSEAKSAVHGARSTHKNIPTFTPETYQLKGKIALYRVPPKKPPTDIIIFKKKEEIPQKNKLGELVFKDHLEFKPNLTPKEVIQAGSFGGTYFRTILSGITGKKYVDAWKEFPSDWFEGLDIKKNVASQIIDASVNKYKVKAGGNLDMWESSGWITEIDPYGWFQWYCRFYLGRRTSDDLRQIKRWLSSCGANGRFRTTLIRKIINAKVSYNDFNIGAVVRQGMLHWGYELTKKDFSDYLKSKLIVKLAKKQ